MKPKPHQQYAVSETIKRLDRGATRLCVSSPTGTGKSLICQMLIEHYGSAVVYANRIALIDQLFIGLERAGLHVGVQAAGYAPDIGAPVQIASIATVHRRWKKQQQYLHDGAIVMIDEIHNEKGRRCCELIEEHVRQGQPVVGLTATPIGIGHMVDDLLSACTTSEGRNCGLLVPAHTYAPLEPDLKAFKKSQVDGLMQIEDRYQEKMMPVIFGSVLEHYRRLNPQRRPTLLFAPGVEESKWFRARLSSAGIKAAHIDGERIIWPDGTAEETGTASRTRLKEDSQAGRIEVVTNRYVMREGVDWPFLEMGILACTFGSVSSYLQAGGRLLRKAPGKDACFISDHGGNYHRHDSLNADRVFLLEHTNAMLRSAQKEIYETKKKAEPYPCPKCKKVRTEGVSCPFCGFASQGKKRMVVMSNGRLKEMTGDIYRRRKVCTAPDAHKKWTACIFRCRHFGGSFNQARALFYRETGGVPDSSFPCVPRHKADWFAKIGTIPWNRCTPF